MTVLIAPPPGIPGGGNTERQTTDILPDLGFCSGYGQYHTNSPDAQKRKPYEVLTWQQILHMVHNPPSVPKAEAQWAIFSTDYTEQARSAEHQRGHGWYGALWVDIDEHCTKSKLFSVVALLQCYAIIYTTSSATSVKSKWRVLIPLVRPIGGERFELCQQVINNRFESAGITPDRKSETANQICYLPNAGSYYDSQIINHLPLFSDSMFEEEIAQIKMIDESNQKEREKKREIKRLATINHAVSGQINVVTAFNEANSLESLFVKYGYKDEGKRWLSPNSQSGAAGVSILDDGNKWVSSHESDFVIGKNANGTAYGDAFDLFVFFENKGNYLSAIKAAGNMLITDTGESVNEFNQRVFMESNKPSVEEMFGNIEPIKTPALRAIDKIKGLSARGKSKKRNEQMLKDVFVLDDLAILGQATVIYAMPNTGKTLLVLKLIVDAIEDGRISGENVFYINADDTFKGATTKLELAERHGFEMLIPNEQGFEMKNLVTLIRGMIKEGSAKGQIIILDTLKKAVDLMDKKLASGFTDLIREFVSAGGTFIALAHTNKHRGADGRLIPQGTSDVRDDMDCVYLLDEISNQNGRKVVEFQNIKSRGNVVDLVGFSYQKQGADDWMEIFNSVEHIDSDKAKEIKKQSVIEERFEKDKEVVMAISQALWGNKKVNRTELINVVKLQTPYSKKVITDVLDHYHGFDRSKRHQWMSVSGDNNAKIYSLLPGEKEEKVSFL